jgi:hypothetical protein
MVFEDFGGFKCALVGAAYRWTGVESMIKEKLKQKKE